jgi:hypothetical protein
MAEHAAGEPTEGEAMVAVTYTSKDIAEAIEKIPADDLEATAIAWCDLHDRITRETGLSEEAVRQMMKKECLLWIEKMRQFGEGMLSGRGGPARQSAGLKPREKSHVRGPHCKSAMDKAHRLPLHAQACIMAQSDRVATSAQRYCSLSDLADH